MNNEQIAQNTPLDLTTNRRSFEKEYPFIKRELQLTPEPIPNDQGQEIGQNITQPENETDQAPPTPSAQPPPAPSAQASPQIPPPTLQEDLPRTNEQARPNMRPDNEYQQPVITPAFIPLWVQTQTQFRQTSQELKFISDMLGLISRYECHTLLHLPPQQRLSFDLIVSHAKNSIRNLYMQKETTIASCQNLLAAIR